MPVSTNPEVAEVVDQSPIAAPIRRRGSPRLVRRMRRLLRLSRPLSFDVSFMRSELGWTCGAEDHG